jgi:hypothetical protein
VVVDDGHAPPTYLRCLPSTGNTTAIQFVCMAHAAGFTGVTDDFPYALADSLLEVSLLMMVSDPAKVTAHKMKSSDVIRWPYVMWTVFTRVATAKPSAR